MNKFQKDLSLLYEIAVVPRFGDEMAPIAAQKVLDDWIKDVQRVQGCSMQQAKKYVRAKVESFTTEILKAGWFTSLASIGNILPIDLYRALKTQAHDMNINESNDFMDGVDALEDDLNRKAIDWAFEEWMRPFEALPGDDEQFIHFISDEGDQTFTAKSARNELREASKKFKVDYAVLKDLLLRMDPKELLENNFMDGVDEVDNELKYIKVLEAAYRHWKEDDRFGTTDREFDDFINVAYGQPNSFARSWVNHFADINRVKWKNIIQWWLKSRWTPTLLENDFMNGLDDVDKEAFFYKIGGNPTNFEKCGEGWVAKSLKNKPKSLEKDCIMFVDGSKVWYKNGVKIK
jgi:hypothetical protein